MGDPKPLRIHQPNFDTLGGALRRDALRREISALDLDIAYHRRRASLGKRLARFGMGLLAVNLLGVILSLTKPVLWPMWARAALLVVTALYGFSMIVLLVSELHHTRTVCPTGKKRKKPKRPKVSRKERALHNDRDYRCRFWWGDRSGSAVGVANELCVVCRTQSSLEFKQAQLQGQIERKKKLQLQQLRGVTLQQVIFDEFCECDECARNDVDRAAAWIHEQEKERARLQADPREQFVAAYLAGAREQFEQRLRDGSPQDEPDVLDLGELRKEAEATWEKFTADLRALGGPKGDSQG